MLSKEQGITVVGVFVVYELLVVQKIHPADVLTLKFVSKTPKWMRFCCQRTCVVIASALVLLVIRIRVMGDKLPVFTRSDNPAATAPTPARQLTFNYLTSLNSWLLLSPSNLICDWTMNTVPLVESVFDVRNVATVVTYVTLGLLIRSALESRY